MLVTRQSLITGKYHTMDMPTVTQERLDQCWRFNPNRQGGHVQQVFPELTPDEREFLITGSTKEEWESTFGNEEDE